MEGTYETSKHTLGSVMGEQTFEQKKVNENGLQFLAFGGTQAPRRVGEYQHGAPAGPSDTVKYSSTYGSGITPEHGYGDNGKGAYKFRYDLIWGGSPGMAEPDTEIAKKNAMMMFKGGAERMAASVPPAVIKKGSETTCSEGYVMREGECVPNPKGGKVACPFGWNLVNGTCVRNAAELMKADANEGPKSEPQALSMTRLRQYIQEHNTGDKTTRAPTLDEREEQGEFTWRQALYLVGSILMFLGTAYAAYELYKRGDWKTEEERMDDAFRRANRQFEREIRKAGGSMNNDRLHENTITLE